MTAFAALRARTNASVIARLADVELLRIDAPGGVAVGDPVPACFSPEDDTAMGMVNGYRLAVRCDLAAGLARGHLVRIGADEYTVIAAADDLGLAVLTLEAV